MSFVKIATRHKQVSSAPAAARGEEQVHSISDLAREFDVSLRALRFYEDRGLLAPQRRGLARCYSNLDRLRLQMILKGKKLGFTLSEIHDLIASGAKGDPAAASLDLHPDQILSQIGHLERQRRDLDSAIGELRATHSRISGGAAHHAA